MSRIRNAMVSGLVLLLGRRRRRPRPEDTRMVPAMPPDPAAELVVLGLLGLSSLCALGFILIYAFGASLPAETQLLGIAIGLAFLLFAAALVVVALRLVPTEEVAEEYPPHEHPGEQQVIAEVIDESGTRLTRARLFKLGLFGAGGTLGLALLAPAVSFGPLFHVGDFLRTPWRRGRRLVDENGRPYKASDIEENDFYLAFPEGTSDVEKEQMAASLVVIRLPVDQLRLPPRLKGYDAHGILAYSRICTHAGCAITLYRAPLFQPDEPRPALVCPCHYSTFDPATGGTVTFGPAGRDLPLLPVYVDSRGYLRAKGNFDGPVGPSWWGVRMWKAQP
ncbi:MAG TPA: Rieske 2Fe-2S domain-containing protein [Gaiellaceae bacterium]|nr:Rieske 2Fe-2S domain-containing protein [Gaiellaceae bacterium]